MRSADRANEQLAKAGKAPLPDGLSPHALRRSFASWLIAEGEDVSYTMQQMGHTDPSMTLGIYARAVRTGRRSVRSQRRLAALDQAPTGTSAAQVRPTVVEEAAA